MDSRKIAMDFKKKFPEFIIGSIMDGGDELIVYLTKPGISKGNFITNNEYRYNKSTGSIKPANRIKDAELYNRAKRHIIYMRPGLRDD